MTGADGFHVGRGNVLAAGDNHVFRTVLDAHVSVRLDHGEITRMQPTAGGSTVGGGRVLQVTVHDDVAAEHDLADGLPVGRHRLQGVRVSHGHRFLHWAGDALTRFQPCAFSQRQRAPFFLRGAYRRGTVGFCQPVYMRYVEPYALGAFDRGRGRGGSGDIAADLVPGLALQLGRGIDQHVVYDGRAAHVRDMILLYGLE